MDDNEVMSNEATTTEGTTMSFHYADHEQTIDRFYVEVDGRHYGNYPQTAKGLRVAERQAEEIAKVAGYVEVKLNGQTVYIAA